MITSGVLICGSFLAGLVDAVVGGGGLILIPLLLTSFPALPIPILFGTNKVAAAVGTTSSCVRYARSVSIPWKTALNAASFAFAGSWLGARAVSLLPKETMKPLVLAMLVVVGCYTFLRKDFGKKQGRKLEGRVLSSAASLLGLAIGLYDGFFGPGTGSFLIFAFVRWFGFDFLKASATAKVVNLATNLAAILFFSTHDGILWKLAGLMALANLLGALLGTHLALKHGNGFIRWLFLGVVSILIAKLGWEIVLPLL